MGRDVDEIVTGGAGIDGALVPALLSDFAFGNFLREGISSVVVVLDFGGAGFEVVAGGVVDDVVEELEVCDLFGKFAFGEVPDFLAGGLIENGDGLGVFDDPVDGSALGPGAGGKLGVGEGENNEETEHGIPIRIPPIVLPLVQLEAEKESR